MLKYLVLFGVIPIGVSTLLVVFVIPRQPAGPVEKPSAPDGAAVLRYMAQQGGRHAADGQQTGAMRMPDRLILADAPEANDIRPPGPGVHEPRFNELAPDFRLRRCSDQKEVRLSAFRGQTPVVLLFGSCD